MTFLFGIFSGLTALFNPAEPQPDNAFAVSQEEGSKYILKEVKKELPHQVDGMGFTNLIGLDTLIITLRFDTDNMEQVRDQSLQAYRAGLKGLKSCRRTFNFTNHGPTSPSYIRIEVTTPKYRSSHIGVERGIFYEPDTMPSTLSTRREPDSLEFKRIQNLFQELEIDGVDDYTTYIEADQQAVGYSIWLAMKKVPNLEESLALYKKIYKEMQKMLEESNPGCFLILRTAFREPSRYSRTLYNIRNNLIDFESIPMKGPSGVNCTPARFHAGFLDDLVPQKLRRELYK